MADSSKELTESNNNKIYLHRQFSYFFKLQKCDVTKKTVTCSVEERFNKFSKLIVKLCCPSKIAK